MKTRTGFLALLFVLVLATPVAAQSVAVKVTGFDSGNFPTVRAFVSVTDASGHAIQTLPKESFKLVEDGRDAEIIAVSASDDAIHVGLIIDRSSSMSDQNKLNDAKIAASAFVDEMRAQDEAFVMMFDTSLAMLQDFTNDRAALKNAIARIGSGGSTAFYEAAYVGADKFASRKEQRKKALILLTDGQDNSSSHSVDEAIAKAKEMNVTLYTIGLGSDADQSRLQRMANETGGKYFFAPRGDQLKELYRLIAEQLQKEYAVDFKTPRAVSDGTQRRVKVTVTLPTGGSQTGEGLYVAGFLFNRFRTDWLIGALLLLVLLLLGFAPSVVGLLIKPQATPAPYPLPIQPPIQTPPPIPAAARCLHCGQPVRANARFCGSCGKTLVAPPASPPIAPTPPIARAIRCPKCGNPVRPGAKFCGKCRYQLRG